MAYTCEPDVQDSSDSDSCGAIGRNGWTVEDKWCGNPEITSTPADRADARNLDALRDSGISEACRYVDAVRHVLTGSEMSMSANIMCSMTDSAPSSPGGAVVDLVANAVIDKVAQVAARQAAINCGAAIAYSTGSVPLAIVGAGVCAGAAGYGVLVSEKLVKDSLVNSAHSVGNAIREWQHTVCGGIAASVRDISPDATREMYLSCMENF